MAALVVGAIPVIVGLTLIAAGFIVGDPHKASLTAWATGFSIFGWGIWAGGWLRGWDDR